MKKKDSIHRLLFLLGLMSWSIGFYGVGDNWRFADYNPFIYFGFALIWAATASSSRGCCPSFWGRFKNPGTRGLSMGNPSIKE